MTSELRGSESVENWKEWAVFTVFNGESIINNNGSGDKKDLKALLIDILS